MVVDLLFFLVLYVCCPVHFYNSDRAKIRLGGGYLFLDGKYQSHNGDNVEHNPKKIDRVIKQTSLQPNSKVNPCNQKS